MKLISPKKPNIQFFLNFRFSLFIARTLQSFVFFCEDITLKNLTSLRPTLRLTGLVVE